MEEIDYYEKLCSIEEQVEYLSTLSKTDKVKTCDYVTDSCTINEEGDVEVNIDYDKTDWVGAWRECNATPIELIDILRETANCLAQGKEIKLEKWRACAGFWKYIAKECEGWADEEAQAEVV